jgi:hypothetical protein
MEQWEDDDVPPFADPNIRPDYVVALGNLILAHNEVDYRLGKALERVVLRIAPDKSLIKYADGSFACRLDKLELFLKAAPNSGAVNLDVVQLRALNTIRNDVAHGHFEQNWDGTFQLVSKVKKSKDRRRKYTSEQLQRATVELRAIAVNLHGHEIFGDFPQTHSLPRGAMPIMVESTE